MLEYGTIIFVGFIFIGLKAPKWLTLRILAYALWVDIGVTLLAYALHFGTFTGMMAAATAGMLMSLFTSAAVRLFGFIKNGEYHPGVIPLSREGMKLKSAQDKLKELEKEYERIQASSAARIGGVLRQEPVVQASA